MGGMRVVGWGVRMDPCVNRTAFTPAGGSLPPPRPIFCDPGSQRLRYSADVREATSAKFKEILNEI